MTKLPAEAYAIIEGKHSDPFRYLGLHSEGGNSVVRAFIPEASNVEAIGEHGETAPLQRIHDAGLFAGALPNGSKRYQLRARFGENVVDLDDPYRFRPCSATSISICWVKVPTGGSTTSSARIR